MGGLAFAVSPELLVYVVNGEVVPAAYEYSLPPANGTPLSSKNCHPAPAKRERLTAMGVPYDKKRNL